MQTNIYVSVFSLHSVLNINGSFPPPQKKGVKKGNYICAYKWANKIQTLFQPNLEDLWVQFEGVIIVDLGKLFTGLRGYKKNEHDS